jgi:hypothetical protein
MYGGVEMKLHLFIASEKNFIERSASQFAVFISGEEHWHLLAEESSIQSGDEGEAKNFFPCQELKTDPSSSNRPASSDYDTSIMLDSEHCITYVWYIRHFEIRFAPVFR